MESTIMGAAVGSVGAAAGTGLASGESSIGIVERKLRENSCAGNRYLTAVRLPNRLAHNNCPAARVMNAFGVPR